MFTLSLTICSLISKTLQSWHTPVRVKATAIAMPAGTQIRLFGYDNSEHAASSFKGSMR